MMSNKITRSIESSDITERLVGITPNYLNNFVQRGTFGLKASVQAGELRAKRRLFSEDDVFGIALVWLLFESGLRTDPIIRILKDIAGLKKASANVAGKNLRESDTNWLIIIRTPRKPSKSIPEKPEQTLAITHTSQLTTLLAQHTGSSVIAIPVGTKFRDIKQRMELLF